jgi:YVTN family beta-propeller protein
MLESVVNQRNILTGAQVGVGETPRFIYTYSGLVYVANLRSDTVSVINPSTNNVIIDIPVGKQPKPYSICFFIASSSLLNLSSPFDFTRKYQ